MTVLEYRRPAWQYSAGSLGAGPRRYNGVGIVVTFNVLVAALLVATNLGPPGAVAPGWYPAPDGPNMMRYFDGRNWTSQTSPRR